MLKATHYNEQLMEWIRNEKEVDWNAFVLNAGNNIYCFESDTLSWTTGGITNIVNDKNECLTALGALYRRYTVFTTTVANGVPTQVNAVVHSEWEEAGGSYSTKLETLFTLWEK